MDAKTVGRELLTIVEIDQDFCSLTYGVGPCAAALGVTGERKCFNTRATCQDPDSFTRDIMTVRFCKAGKVLPAVPCIPLLSKTSTAPTEINPGGGGSSGPLGKRARVTLEFIDAPHSDIGVDPYQTERDYDAMERGTFWSKWLARNPYYNNRVVRIREGYVGQTLEQMVTRTYLIDKIDGPDSRARVKVTARDILALADNDKAQAPAASSGALNADMTAVSTAGIIVKTTDASEYPSAGTVRIQDELIRYTSKSIGTGTVTLGGVTRGTDGSEPASHQEDDRVQLCLRYTEKRVDEIVQDLLTTYGGVPDVFIPSAEWAVEVDNWLDQFDLTGLVTEPTGVQALLAEITEQCLFYIWWDERNQEIRLEAIKPPTTDAEVPKIDDEFNILADSAEATSDPKQRASQVLVYWAQRNPAKKLDEESNYVHLTARVDAEAEASDQYGERIIKKIFSRWLHTDGQAINSAVRLLGRYRDNPRYLTLSLDAKDRSLWTGNLVDVTCRQIVDDTGLPQAQRWQVVSAEEKVPGHSATYKLFAYEFKIGARPGRWMAADAADYIDATEIEREEGGWWADESGRIPTGVGEETHEGYSWI